MDVSDDEYFFGCVNANIILGVCGITQEEIPLCHDLGTFVTVCITHVGEERFHNFTVVLCVLQNNEKFYVHVSYVSAPW